MLHNHHDVIRPKKDDVIRPKKDGDDVIRHLKRESLESDKDNQEDNRRIKPNFSSSIGYGDGGL